MHQHSCKPYIHTTNDGRAHTATEHHPTHFVLLPSPLTFSRRLFFFFLHAFDVRYIHNVSSVIETKRPDRPC